MMVFSIIDAEISSVLEPRGGGALAIFPANRNLTVRHIMFLISFPNRHIFCSSKNLEGNVKKSFALVAAAAISVSACAKQADQVTASYVSPAKYSSYSCKQIENEARSVASKVSQLSGAQNEQAGKDAAITAAAIVLFWPAAFFVGGNDMNTAELSRLKGDLEALESASNQKNCGLVFRSTTAPS